MSKKEIPVFYPSSQAAWREWLAENHETEQAVWLVYYKKSSNKPSLSWSNAVDEALCFGWIDSKHVSIDHESSQQYFGRRKPNSTWSKVNKDKVEQLIAQGLMTEAGFKSIAVAKANGSWTILDEVEQYIIPPDLEAAFTAHPKAQDFYLSLSKSIQKSILQWLVMAKTTATREKRIAEIIESGEQQLKPKYLR